MTRSFANNGYVITSIGGCGSIDGGPISMAALVKRTADGGEDTIVAMASSGGANQRSAMYVSSGNLLVAMSEVGKGDSSTMTIAAADGWQLLGWEKANGNVAGNFHRLVLSTQTWTHEATAAFADGTAPGQVQIGVGASDGTGYWNGDIEAVAIWDVALTQAQWESMGADLMSWLALGPKGMWVFDQAAVTTAVKDLTGNGANETSRANTSVTSTSPPFSWGVPILPVTVTAPAGGASAVPAMMHSYRRRRVA